MAYTDLAGISDQTDPVFKQQFLSLLPQFLGGKNYSDDQIAQAIQGSTWYGKLGSGSDPYNAAYEVGLKLGSTAPLGSPGSIYDPNAEASSNQAAIDRSPEAAARRSDSGGFLGLGDLGTPLMLGGLALGGAGLAGYGPLADLFAGSAGAGELMPGWDEGAAFGGTSGGATAAGTGADGGAMDMFGSQATPGAAYNGTVFDTPLNPATGGLSLSNIAGGAGIGSSLLSNLLGFDTGISNGDLMRSLGSLGAAGLGAVGSSNQARSLSNLANQYSGFGAPSRARYEASFAPGFTMASDPGYSDALDQTAKATLRGLSTTGNPAGSPNAWTQTLSDVNSKFAYPALQQYRSTNAAGGGLGSAASAAPTIATQAIGANANIYNSIGAGMADIFTPQKSLSQILREARL